MTDRASQGTRHHVDGPAGVIQVLQESPAERDPVGVALICHPHPLHGGTMDNKVVYTLARAFLATNCAVFRFNYRGVGESEGTFDGGIGETEDALAVAAWAATLMPDLPMYIGGFSFGSMISLRACEALPSAALITVAPPIARISAEISQPICPWLVIQGDADDIVSPAEVAAWVKSLEPGPELKIMIGAEHFFHGRLSELRNIVTEFLDRHPYDRPCYLDADRIDA
jgi:uncharacterized protein